MDVGKNPRGTYVRMTEQSANYRQSITVPDRHFRAIGEWYIAAAEQLEKTGMMPENDDYYAKGDNNRNRNQHDNRQDNRKQDHGNRRRSRDDDEYDE
jgi:hypothetical protein